MEVEKYDNGVPGWVDLGSPDLDAARAFYSGLFGWDIPPGPEEAGGYSIAMLRGRPVAGIGPAMNPGPPVWATYVIVDSADNCRQEGEGQRRHRARRADGRARRGPHGRLHGPEGRRVLGVAGRSHAGRGHRQRAEQLQLERARHVRRRRRRRSSTARCSVGAARPTARPRARWAATPSGRSVTARSAG